MENVLSYPVVKKNQKMLEWDHSVHLVHFIVKYQRILLFKPIYFAFTFLPQYKKWLWVAFNFKRSLQLIWNKYLEYKPLSTDLLPASNRPPYLSGKGKKCWIQLLSEFSTIFFTSIVSKLISKIAVVRSTAEIFWRSKGRVVGVNGLI